MNSLFTRTPDMRIDRGLNGMSLDDISLETLALGVVGFLALGGLGNYFSGAPKFYSKNPESIIAAPGQSPDVKTRDEQQHIKLIGNTIEMWKNAATYGLSFGQIQTPDKAIKFSDPAFDKNHLIESLNKVTPEQAMELLMDIDMSYEEFLTLEFPKFETVTSPLVQAMFRRLTYADIMILQAARFGAVIETKTGPSTVLDLLLTNYKIAYSYRVERKIGNEYLFRIPIEELQKTATGCREIELANSVGMDLGLLADMFRNQIYHTDLDLSKSVCAWKEHQSRVAGFQKLKSSVVDGGKILVLNLIPPAAVFTKTSENGISAGSILTELAALIDQKSIPGAHIVLLEKMIETGLYQEMESGASTFMQSLETVWNMVRKYYEYIKNMDGPTILATVGRSDAFLGSVLASVMKA